MSFFIPGEGFPKKAGVAELHFDSKTATPQRDGTHLTLPLVRDAEFFALKGGEQFVADFGSQFGYQGTRFWFGGTDEGPFLVGLQEKPVKRLLEDGEDGFFDALKPNLVKRLERELKVTTRRQGDIFAVPLPWSWHEVNALSLCLTGKIVAASPFRVKQIPVLDTRHRLTGKALQTLPIATGVLSAPDHKPLRLSGLHWFAQAEGLWDPENAD